MERAGTALCPERVVLLQACMLGECVTSPSRAKAER